VRPLNSSQSAPNSANARAGRNSQRKPVMTTPTPPAGVRFALGSGPSRSWLRRVEDLAKSIGHSREIVEVEVLVAGQLEHVNGPVRARVAGHHRNVGPDVVPAEDRDPGAAYALIDPRRRVDPKRKNVGRRVFRQVGLHHARAGQVGEEGGELSIVATP